MRVIDPLSSALKCERSYFERFYKPEYMCSALCGMITFPTTISLFQHLVWKPLGIAAHSRMAGLCGIFTVGTSALLSTIAVSSVHDVMLGVDPMTTLTKEDAAIFTAFSLVQFIVLARRLYVVMPSHILHPGAYARQSVPLYDYDVKVSKGQKREINRLGRKHGCHTCGKRYSLQLYKILSKLPLTKVNPRALYFGDHSPPMAIANSTVKGLKNGSLYPQCQNCSNFQSSCVRLKLNNPTGSLSKFFVTHTFRLKMWKVWLPWPLIISSAFLDYSKDTVYQIMETLQS